MKKYRVSWVDPPQGWMYGFPKGVDDAYHKLGPDKTQWYLDNGYPKELEHLLEHTRMGLEEVVDDS